MLSSWWLELKQAARGLRRDPGFSIAVVLLLAIGIGANATIFSAVNGIVLQPLPYADADRIVNIWNDLGDGAQSLPAVHPADYLDYKRMATLFEDFSAATGGRRTGLNGILTGDGSGAPERVVLSPVSANFFPLLGVEPALGRGFRAEEEVHDGPAVALLTHGLWQRRYGGDPDILGGTITIDGVSHEVIGVLPKGFRLHLPAEAFLLRDSEIWLPLQIDYGDLPPRNFTPLTVLGRLKPGVTIAQAQAEMDSTAERLRAEHPVHAASNLRIRVIPLQHDVVKGVRPLLIVLQVAVAFVLLIVCANVANLLLVRGAARQRIFAVRTALGAGSRRLVQGVLAEGLLLALVGGVLGIGLAVFGVQALTTLAPGDLPRLADVRVDGTVLIWTAAASLLTVLVFAVVPALRASKVAPSAALHAESRSVAGKARDRWRSVFVIAEVALSLVLLIGAGLSVRSFAALQDVRPGFDPEGVLTFRLQLPRADYPTHEVRDVFFRGLEQELSALPGVISVSATSQLPLTGSGPLAPFAYDERTAHHWESVTAEGRSVSPGYFKTMGTALLSGRDFTEDDAGTGRVIIDETLARTAWGDADPVGELLQVEPTGDPEPYVEVVGVVEHARMQDLSRELLPHIYRPLRLGLSRTYVVRTAGDPAALVHAVRATLSGLDPQLPVTDLRPMTAFVDDALAGSRLSHVLMLAFGGLALLLAAVGVYGVLAYSVRQRTREFGIRLALGERPAALRRSVLFHGLRLVGVSLVLGLAVAAVLSTQLTRLLYGVHPIDPVTFILVPLGLAIVAIGACYLPARRATLVDPATVLRAD